MTNERQIPSKIEEFLALLEQDPGRVAFLKRQRGEKVRRVAAQYRIDEAPVVGALNDAGVHVQSIWDLVNSAGPYPKAIPVLLKHLSKPHPPSVREGIARALASP
jgi:HEAT repeat protein